MKSLLCALLVATLLAGPAVAAAQECIVPDLFVVLDRSGSMLTEVDNRTRWAIARDALTLLATLDQSSVRWGFLAYPGESSCGAGVVSVPLPSSGLRVVHELSQLSPAGGTPIAESLELAREAMLAGRTDRPQWLLLITDGQPNCNGALDGETCACTCLGAECSCVEDPRNCLDDLRTEAAVQALRADGISTFVLGFGDEVSTEALDRLAEVGGTAAAESPRFIPARTAQAFVDALDAVAIGIGVATRSCSGPCNESVQRCTEEGWGRCEASLEGDVRACRTADGSGIQSCTAEGWGGCEVSPADGAGAAADTGCDCGTGPGPAGALGFVALLCGLCLRRRSAPPVRGGAGRRRAAPEPRN